jgi:hypothetical protein
MTRRALEKGHRDPFGIASQYRHGAEPQQPETAWQRPLDANEHTR